MAFQPQAGFRVLMLRQKRKRWMRHKPHDDNKANTSNVMQIVHRPMVDHFNIERKPASSNSVLREGSVGTSSEGNALLIYTIDEDAAATAVLVADLTKNLYGHMTYARAKYLSLALHRAANRPLTSTRSRRRPGRSPTTLVGPRICLCDPKLPSILFPVPPLSASYVFVGKRRSVPRRRGLPSIA